MGAPAGGIWLDGAAIQPPGLSKTFGQAIGVGAAGRKGLEKTDPRLWIENPGRAGEAVCRQQRSGHPTCRRLAGMELFGLAAVMDETPSAASEGASDAQRLLHLTCIEIQKKT